MISNKLAEALNRQINAELFSAYMYLSMSAYLADNDLTGFANWMRVQAQEETLHAMKMYDYLIERQSVVKLTAIDAPPIKWDGPLSVFVAAYEHEQKVTSLINNLMDIAIAEKDHAGQIFLQWFVNEQVEEESSANAVVQKLKLMGGAPGGLYMLDNELGTRVFNPPAAAQQ